MEWWKEQQLSTQSICNQDNRIRMNLGLCKDIMYTSLDWNQSINSSVNYGQPYQFILLQI